MFHRLAVLAFWATVMWAQTISGVTNTVTCSSPQTILTLQDAPAECRVDNGGTASANSQMSLSGNTFSFTTNTSSTDYNAVSQGASYFLSASSKAVATLFAGGSGTGYAVVSGQITALALGTATSSLQCAMVAGDTVLLNSGGTYCGGRLTPIPIQLGSIIPFNFSTFTSEAESLTGDENGQGQASGTVSVSFYAADGVTPVPVTWLSGAQALSFVPVTPCRVVDTRNTNGAFGGPALGAGETRSWPIPNGACNIPSSAYAYSLNVTAVPNGSLGYLTLWPSDEQQPNVSTLNSLDGRIKASAAIVPAGTDGSGAVSAYVTDPTNLILDINGYFELPTFVGGYLFHPVQPCRIYDTRQPGDGPLIANLTRSFGVAGICGVPAWGSSDFAVAYSLNITAIPRASQLEYLTMWPGGGSIPLVSTLNAPTGTITANAAIVPAGTGGAISALATDSTDLVIDVNGYFSYPDSSGLYFFPISPARILDTRLSTGVFSGTLPVDVLGTDSAIPAAAQAYVLNATVVPVGSLGWLSLWPDGVPMPLSSTLNAYDGAITSNMAIVPSGNNGFIDAFASNPTDLILDIFGYFR